MKTRYAGLQIPEYHEVANWRRPSPGDFEVSALTLRSFERFLQGGFSPTHLSGMTHPHSAVLIIGDTKPGDVDSDREGKFQPYHSLGVQCGTNCLLFGFTTLVKLDK